MTDKDNQIFSMYEQGLLYSDLADMFDMHISEVLDAIERVHQRLLGEWSNV